MNHEKITYFFRSNDKFLDFLERYPILKKFHIKNEEMFSYKTKSLHEISLKSQKNWQQNFAFSEIIIISSEIILCFFLENLDIIHDLIFTQNKKNFIFVGENLKNKFLKKFPEISILFCGNSIFDIENFLNNFLKKNPKKILYLRGAIIKYDLRNSEFNKDNQNLFNELIVYSVFYKDFFSSEFQKNFLNSEIKNLVFFSEESFRNFEKTIIKSFPNNIIEQILKNLNIFWLGDYDSKEKHLLNIYCSKIFKAKNHKSESLVSMLLEKI